MVDSTFIIRETRYSVSILLNSDPTSLDDFLRRGGGSGGGTPTAAAAPALLASPPSAAFADVLPPPGLGHLRQRRRVLPHRLGLQRAHAPADAAPAHDDDQQQKAAR